jgi:hypothetical protein
LVDPSLPTPEEAAALVTWPNGAVICYAKCAACQFQQCPGGEHRWADGDDIEHAESIGRPETAEGTCGCPCAKGPVVELEPPDIDEVSLDGPPCHLCGAPGACGYDAEGRPYIHASWDEDDTEEVR